MSGAPQERVASVATHDRGEDRLRALLQNERDLTSATLAVAAAFPQIHAIETGAARLTYEEFAVRLAGGDPPPEWLAVAEPSAARALLGRALRLFQIVGLEPGRRFAASQADAGLTGLTRTLAWLSASTLVDDPATADVVVACGGWAPIAGLPETAAVVSFGSAIIPEAAPQALAARPAPVWFVEEMPKAGIDLYASSASATDAGAVRFEPLRQLRVIDESGEVLPPHMPGRIAIDRGPRGALVDTGRRGRQGRDGSIVPESWASGDLRVGTTAVDTRLLGRDLMGAGAVRDLHVLAKQTRDDERALVAYYVPGKSAVQSHGRLRGRLSALEVPCALVETPAIPLTGAGRPDESYLAGLPVADPRNEEPGLRDIGIEPRAVLASRWRWTSANPGRRVPLASIPDRTASTPVVEAAADGSASILAGPAMAGPALISGCLTALLDRNAAEARGDDLVVIERGEARALSYADLAASARRAAAVLQVRGVRRGARVVLYLESLELFLVWFWGCLFAGAVATPIGVSGDEKSDRLRIDGLAKRLDAALVVSDTAAPGSLSLPVCPALRDPQGEMTPVEANGEDLALILATSGSTGEPKLVMQTHRALLAQGFASGEAIGLGPDDASLNWMPFDHVGGLVMFHLRDTFASCRQIHVAREFILAEPLRWLDLIDEHRATVSWAPNFAFALIADRLPAAKDRSWSLSSIRYLINGGEAIIPSVTRRFIEITKPHGLDPGAIKPAWGMSETCSLVLVDSSRSDRKFDDDSGVAVGGPIRGVEVRIVDDEDRPVCVAAEGRLQVRGPMIMRGYFGEDAANAFTADGWLDTGDRARMADGSVWITGRDKDIVIVNGRNISCFEIERKLLDVEGTERAHTTVVPCREGGGETELPVIFFVPAAGAEPREVAAALCRRLTERLHLTGAAVATAPGAIPRTRIGKPQRQLLRAQLERGVFDADLVRNAPSSNSTLPAWFFRPEMRPARARSGGRQRLSWAILSEATPDPDLTSFLSLKGVQIRHVPLASARDGFAGGSELDGVDTLLIPIERLEGRRGDTLLLDALAGAARVHDLLCIAAVTGPPTTASEAAHLGALKGLLASMPHEREGWSTRWVEFPAGLGAAERASLLVAESETAGGDFAVGYGEAGRSHEVLAPDYFLTNHPPAVRSGGRYLVSGACGGLGRIVTQWLCEVWRAEVIGVGRTPAGSAAAPSHSRFRYVQADVTDAAALEAAVPEEALLDGVFHLAGDFELRDLDALDAARHERLTSAKVDGALQCVELLRRRGMPAPLFVLFGSVNSHFGGSGAASYAAANAAQQKLADHLNASGEITTYYLGWSQWPELGLSRANPAAALSERRGFLPIDASRGSSSLTRALAGPAGVLFIGLNSECPAIMGETGLRLAPPLLEIELAGDRARPPARILDRFGTAFDIRFEAPHAALLQTAGYRRMTEQITAIWQELLGQEAVDLDRNFFELGGNSLKLLQAKGRLESALRRPLEVADLLRYPTIRQLAAHLETATNRPADVRAASSLSTQASERGEARAARRTLRRRE